jgi:hypothetical protein
MGSDKLLEKQNVPLKILSGSCTIVGSNELAEFHDRIRVLAKNKQQLPGKTR